MNISEYIPGTVRKPLYGALAVAGVAIGAVQVGYASIEHANPTWLTVTLAVYPFVAAALGFTAAANTPASKPITGDEPIAVTDDEDDEPGIDLDAPDDDAIEDDDTDTPQVAAQEELDAALAAGTLPRAAEH